MRRYRSIRVDCAEGNGRIRGQLPPAAPQWICVPGRTPAQAAARPDVPVPVIDAGSSSASGGATGSAEPKSATMLRWATETCFDLNVRPVPPVPQPAVRRAGRHRYAVPSPDQ